MWWPFIIGCALRLLLPWYNHGFRSMDEHWQVIEPAHFLLHGDWFRTTEWVHGLRSWIYPSIVSSLMGAAEAIGIREPIWIVAFVRMIHGLLSSFAVPLVYLSVKRLSVGQKNFAKAAAWFTALWPFVVYGGFHTQGEYVGAVLILAAIASTVLISKNENDTGYLFAGGFFGAALAFKIDLAVAGLGFGVWQALNGRFTRTLALLAGASPFIFLVGWTDQVAWGQWFHSVAGHARVNLLEQIGNQWGTSPWYTHVLYYFDITSIVALAAVVMLPALWRKLPEKLRAVWFMNFFFVACYCLIPHKEKRFLAPLMYTAIVASFTTLAVVRDEILLKKISLRIAPRHALYICTFALAVHGSATLYTYWIKRPWWNRIEAIRNAGQIPDIEKMLSPHWPMPFYLPRQVPSKVVKADVKSLWIETLNLRHIGVATDAHGLFVLKDLGFECSPWPKAPTTTKRVPWAYDCLKTSELLMNSRASNDRH